MTTRYRLKITACMPFRHNNCSWKPYFPNSIYHNKSTKTSWISCRAFNATIQYRFSRSQVSMKATSLKGQPTAFYSSESTLPESSGSSPNSLGSYRTPDPNLSSKKKNNYQLTTSGKLSWNDYFALRLRRKRMERVITIPTTLLGFGISCSYVVTRELDPTPILGQDPMVIYGASVILCGFAGFLIGPVIGSSIWKLFHRKEVRLMEQRDREFYQHIKQNRADPSLNSIRNPAPDYYGEKIKSVAEYRTWLRKQREFLRKGTFHLGEE
ncbi:hypothetical protein G9A89_012876 [Geosiphon pyriformis]|nr:hypothetical protein G9A89_012876 [Geosiphon pyriformis]